MPFSSKIFISLLAVLSHTQTNSVGIAFTKDYNPKMENWGFETFAFPFGEGNIDLKAVLKILLEECHLDRIMLEIPVKKEATLTKDDYIVRKSVQYCREVLGI